jgi:hypothetical protein
MCESGLSNHHRSLVVDFDHELELALELELGP